MNNKKFYKAESRKDWCTSFAITNEDIQTGCLQRIADATEKMAGNYIALENDRDYYRRWKDRVEAENDILRRRVAAYKGIIKRLKK